MTAAPANAPGGTAGHGTLSVLVVDDHKLFAEVLCRRLLDLDRVRSATPASTLTEATAAVHTLRPDVVFVDHDLDGESGIDLLARIAPVLHPPPVAVLSASSDSRLIIRALEHGARAWVVKNGKVDDLMAAAEALLRGETYVSAQVANDVVRLLIEEHAPTGPPSFADDLSPRAYAVLRCLVSGMTRAETAARLYISPNTVRTHVQKLLRASGTHSTLALVSAARACGIPEMDELPHPSGRSSA